jgi:hypothetical protein
MSERDTLLMEIFERLGSIDAKLQAGSERHREFADRMKEIETKIAPVPLISETVSKMKPIVEDYQASRQKAAGIMLAITGFAGAVGFFASEIKAFFMGRH